MLPLPGTDGCVFLINTLRCNVYERRASMQGGAREAELKAWLALHEAAELSLTYRTAIFFG